MSSSGAEPLTVSVLATRLRCRLDELETERDLLVAALQALSGAPATTTSGFRDARGLILDALSSGPGVRRSMLALACGLPIADVDRELELLAAAGLAKPDGLGWKLAGATLNSR